MVTTYSYSPNNRATARQNENSDARKRVSSYRDSEEFLHDAVMTANANAIVSYFSKVSDNHLSILQFGDRLQAFLPNLEDRELWKFVRRELGHLMGGGVREWYNRTGCWHGSAEAFAVDFNSRFHSAARDLTLNRILNDRPCGTSSAALEEYILTTFTQFSSLGDNEPSAARFLQLAWANNLYSKPLLATLLTAQLKVPYEEWNMENLCDALIIALGPITHCTKSGRDQRNRTR